MKAWFFYEREGGEEAQLLQTSVSSFVAFPN